MKIGRSVEAVDVAFTFGVEETFHPQQAVVTVCGFFFFFFFFLNFRFAAGYECFW